MESEGSLDAHCKDLTAFRETWYYDFVSSLTFGRKWLEIQLLPVL